MIEVNTQFYRRDKDQERAVSEISRVIGGYIKAIGKETCDEALLHDTREDIKFHLGTERRSTVSWYPFKENSIVLEVGGEFGAITGELCDKAFQVIVTEPSFFRAQVIGERYKNRQNLKIYAGDVMDMDLPYKFDYIVVMNMVDKIGNHTVANTSYIKNFLYLQKFLKEDGKLILADENLYSIWKCQQSDGSLNPWNHCRHLYKKQIASFLQQAGFYFIKFYYPLPGYHLVGRIYTDDLLPTAAEWNCLSNFNCADQNFLSANMDMLTRLTENNMFSFLAPAYFVEAGRIDNLSTIKGKNVLFGDDYELPLLGFDWAKHGYSSMLTAIDTYRLKIDDSTQSEEYRQHSKLKSAILKVDQDHEVIEKVVDTQLDLLRRLKQICDTHELKLYAMYGTLLGAVRNGGIIAGDDDIDVALFREDYNKLIALKNEFEEPYFLQTPANDNCFYGGYLKLRNRNTTSLHPQNWWVDCCEGISIDIFPIDSGFADPAKEKKKEKKIKYIQRLLYAKAYGYFPNFKDMKLLRWKFYKYCSKFFSREQLANKLDVLLEGTDDGRNCPLAIYTHYLGEKQPKRLDKDAFKKTIVLSFEDINLLAPADWDCILRKLYGDNYIEPWPWSEGKYRHGFYDTERAYQIYKKSFSGLFRPVPSKEKKIILFGDGSLYEEYFKKYGSRYEPKDIISFTYIETDQYIHGIKVKNMDEFLQLSEDNIYPIICALDIRKAQEEMRKAGIYEYYIFLKSRSWMLLANYTFILGC